MHDGWTVLRLGDAVEIKHGFAFPGSEFSADPDYPTVVTPGNFRIGGGFQQTKVKTFSGDVPDGFVLEPGDLIVTMTDLSKTGDTLGYPAFVPGDRTYLHNQRIGKVLLRDRRLADLRYLALVMQTTSYRAHVLGTASGSTVRHTSPSRILDYKAPFPPLQEQQRIAGVLGAIDDLIDSLEVTCVQIDRLQCAIFCSQWDGSTRVPLSELGTITMGQSPPGETYNERGEGLPFYQGVKDFGLRHPARRVYCTVPTRLAHKGDVLIAVRAPIGDTNVAVEDCSIGRGLATLASDRPSTTLQALRCDPNLWSRFQGDGTVFAAVNRQTLAANRVPWAEDQRLEMMLAPMDVLYRECWGEAKRLRKHRDELLPFLLSGRVQVEDGAV